MILFPFIVIWIKCRFSHTYTPSQAFWYIINNIRMNVNLHFQSPLLSPYLCSIDDRRPARYFFVYSNHLEKMILLSFFRDPQGTDSFLVDFSLFINLFSTPSPK